MFLFFDNISMIELLLNELQLAAKGIKGFKSIPKKRLLSPLSTSEIVESKKSLDDERLKKVKKDFNYK